MSHTACEPTSADQSAESVAILPAKVIQIQVVSHPGAFNCGPHSVLYALLETGAIYKQYESSGSSNVPTDGRWYCVTP